MSRPTFLALVVVLACQDPTQITLDLSTNAACPNEPLGKVRLVDVGISAGEVPLSPEVAFITTTESCDAPPSVGTLVLTPSDSRSGDLVDVLIVAGAETDDGKPTRNAGQCRDFITPNAMDQIEGIDQKNCIVIRRRLGFVPATPLRLPIEIDTRCLGVECGEDLTCFQGKCVSPDVTCDEKVTADLKVVLAGPVLEDQAGEARAALVPEARVDNHRWVWRSATTGSTTTPTARSTVTMRPVLRRSIAAR